MHVDYKKKFSETLLWNIIDVENPIYEKNKNYFLRFLHSIDTMPI